MPTNFFSSRESAPPFIRPFLDTLDGMREHEVRSPEALQSRARRLLAEQFESSSQSAEAVFAQGAISLLSDHTHYSNGFAVLMPIQQGTAVAIRRAEGASSQVVFAGSETTWPIDAENEAADVPVWVRVVERVAAQLVPPTVDVEMAVVSTVPASCLDAYLAALAVATTRAVLVDGGALGAAELEPVLKSHLPMVRRVLAKCTELPFSIAFPIASFAGSTDTFTLVDTATYESLPIETTARDELGWSLLDPMAVPRDATFHRERREQADEAIELLQARAFDGLTSFRDLEHQDLPQAIDVLPPHLTSVVRHLVTENRRVQKLVAAMRRNDWQMVGALLLMSHASRRDAWMGTSTEADFLVEQVESLTLESIYGACMTGRGGYVVLVGQPHAMLLGLDELTTAFEQRFGYAPEAMLL